MRLSLIHIWMCIRDSYTVSTLYHALNVNRAKRVFRVLDHCTICLLSAGTYTPSTLCCLGGTAGLVLLLSLIHI